MLTSCKRYKSGSLGIPDANEFLYGVICSHAVCSSFKSKYFCTISACALDSFICPKQAATVHSLLRFNCSASVDQSRSCSIFDFNILRVTSSRNECMMDDGVCDMLERAFVSNNKLKLINGFGQPALLTPKYSTHRCLRPLSTLQRGFYLCMNFI